jgi:hypothetical protein
MGIRVALPPHIPVLHPEVPMQTITMVAFGVVLVTLLYAGTVLLFRRPRVPVRNEGQIAEGR